MAVHSKIAKYADRLLSEVNSKEFLAAISCVMKWHAEHGENAVAAFTDAHYKDAAVAVNAARRYIEGVYWRALMLVKCFGLPVEKVLSIMESGSVRIFLDKVHVLSEAKTGASTTVKEQREFWEAIYAGNFGSIAIGDCATAIDFVEFVLEVSATVNSDEFLADIVSVCKFVAEHRDKAIEVFMDVHAASTTAQINAARRAVDGVYNRVRVQVEDFGMPEWLVRYIMESGSVDVYLGKVLLLCKAKAGASTTVPKQEAFWAQFGTQAAA